MTSKINVLFVSHFNHLRMGGQKSMLSLIENLDSEKFNCFALVNGEGELTEKLREVNCTTYILPLTKLSLNNFFKVLSNLINIKNLIHENNIDIIHPDYERDAFLCGLATYGTKAKMVWHVRVTRNNNLDKFNYKLSDGMICISKGAEKRFDAFVKEGYKKTKIIFNGVDTNKFKPVEDRKKLKSRLGLDENKFTVLFAGQMKEEKGIFDIVRSAEILKEENIEIICLGEFIDQETKNRWMDSVNENSPVKWLGQKSDIHKWMQAADSLILPSFEGSEGMGRVVFEAMSCGTPPIASDISGVKEAITDDTGILIPERSPKKLADSILELSKNHELWKKLSMQGRKRALEVFDIKIHAEKVGQYYQEILSK